MPSNIFDNALKYHGANPSFKVETKSTPGKIKISFKDNGIGMGKSQIGQAFDKYYRSERIEVQSAKGMGLGLFYCKKIIGLHQGSIKMASKIGVGSELTITLPI